MIKDLKFENDIINTLSSVLETNGKTGELRLQFPDGSSRINWVGKANHNDILIIVNISKWENTL
jgi:hypothetical protein